MNSYKPYAYLYKSENEPAYLISCFTALIPAGKNLSGPTITTVGDQTTITYSIVADASHERPWNFEADNEIEWDGDSHDVEIVIGSGSGATGGGVTISSNNAEVI
jgi:hypothetical protein